MTVSAELQIQRKNTTAFINTQPVEIVLIPRAPNRQPTGGVVWEELDPRPKQIMRLIEPASPQLPVRTLDGIQRQVNFILLGEWDAEMGTYDVFEMDGSHWEIIQLIWNNRYEVRAEVARYG